MITIESPMSVLKMTQLSLILTVAYMYRASEDHIDKWIL